MECMEVRKKDDEVSKECNELRIQKNYYKETFRFIDESLKLEDKGKESEAILCYKKSLRSIKNGMAISIKHSELNPTELKQYESVKEKLSKAQQEVLHRLSTLKEVQPVDMEAEVCLHPEGMDTQLDPVASVRNDQMEEVVTKEKDVVREVAVPSAPPDSGSSNIGGAMSAENEENKTWHDTKELINIGEGVRLFHVNGSEISTWTSHCSLQIFQILQDKLDELSPPAFLKCGEWLFPMEPGQSPVLKSGPRTYMFPDMSNNGQQVTDPSTLPCVGIVLADFVSDAIVSRFERVLSLYTDFRKELTGAEREKPKRPPPPVTKQRDGEHKTSSRTGMKESRSSSRSLVVSDMETIVAEPGVAEDAATQEGRWSTAITKGIHIGSQWISWGFIKGSEYTSILVQKGSSSLQKRIKPNTESLSVSPEVSNNIRQLHETTGSVVQISAFLASALGTLVINLGKNLAPLVLQHGQKLLPDKYKIENNEKTQNVIDNARKVAVAGLQGFSLIFLALEQSGKTLYQSVSKATVETMQHKYGDKVGEVTSDAMGAAGNTAQVLWNVRKLGPKAIAKRTAKETGKAIIDYDEQENPYASYHKNGIG